MRAITSSVVRPSILVICGIFGVILGCGDDDANGPNEVPTNGHVTLTLDGTVHAFDGGATGIPVRPGLIQASALKASGNELVTLSTPDTLGETVLGVDGGVNLNISVGGVAYTATDHPGTLTVTAISSTRVAGTFSGMVEHADVDSIVLPVTDGSFDIPLTNLPIR